MIAECRTKIMAKDAIALMDHLGWRKAHIFGHSMGESMILIFHTKILTSISYNLSQKGWLLNLILFPPKEKCIGVKKFRLPSAFGCSDLNITSWVHGV